MPDSWAIKQLFPIMPIHRLNEPPTRRAVLGDITCDSDGKIDQFIDLRDVRNTLELHPLQRRSPITWARSCSARIRKSSATCTTCSATPTPSTSASTTTARYSIDEVIKGDTVREVLAYVQYTAEKLIDRMRKDVEKARAGRQDHAERIAASCCGSTSRGWKGILIWRSESPQG